MKESQTLQNIAIFGASGAIGSAFTNQLANKNSKATIFAFSRSDKQFEYENVHSHAFDITDEKSIETAITIASAEAPLDLVLITTGLLHQNLSEKTTRESLGPEKALIDLSSDKFKHLFEINTIGPALIAKHALPQMRKDKPSIFAALSARVSSISDNHLGGWYAYRSSKAALNMIIKTASIEMKRRNKNLIVIGLHPGTVDSDLSKPFQKNTPKDKLFSADHSVTKMLEVLEERKTDDTGKLFAWDGQDIQF
ncbi:MAG: SDR family oxidoreductase [Methyloligella sp.]|nr:MAG: SDR family oxidoreductase [Methyloligella sp.]